MCQFIFTFTPVCNGKLAVVVGSILVGLKL